MAKLPINYEVLNTATGERMLGESQAEADGYARSRSTPGDYMETYSIDPLGNRWMARNWTVEHILSAEEREARLRVAVELAA